MAKLCKDTFIKFITGDEASPELDISLMHARITTIQELKQAGFSDSQAMRIERCIMLAVESSRAERLMKSICFILFPLALYGFICAASSFLALFGGNSN